MGLLFSPILFNLYYFFIINELKLEIKNRLVSYADDTTIILNKKGCFNNIMELEKVFSRYNIKINREKSVIAFIENGIGTEEIKKLTELGYMKKDNNFIRKKIHN